MSGAAGKTIDLQRRYTVAEWREITQASESKYEYVDGRLIDVRAMAGGTENHALIEFNLARALGNALEGKPCRGLSSNMAVRAKQMARFRYPDASIVCGPSEFEEDDTRRTVLLNPRVIIEILSETTEAADRGEKFRDYQEISSLREYLLISQDQALVENFFRRDDGTWLISNSSGISAVAKLHSVDVELRLSDLYAGVTLPKASDAI